MTSKRDDATTNRPPPPTDRQQTPPAGTAPAASASASSQPPPPPPPETADSQKELGNAAIRAGNYSAAVLHYTHAIKLSVATPDAILHSNRSLAFLRLKSLYYANEDAERAIQLRPDWAKAYFRRGEVQQAAGQYDTALLSYARALQLQPTDANIMIAAKRVAALSNIEAQFEKRLPWVGAGLGIVMGVIIVLSDQLATKSPSIRHPSLMVLLVMVVSGIGYGIARLFRYYKRLQQRGLLEPPVDMLAEFRRSSKAAAAGGVESEGELLANRNRYSKAQARQRFRKGKT